MSEPFYHTVIGDPVKIGHHPVKEGDLWMSINKPLLRKNGQWVETDDKTAWQVWELLNKKQG